MKKRFCENEKSMMKASVLRMVKQKDAETLSPEGTVAPWAAGHTSPESLPQTAARDKEPLCSIATEALCYLNVALILSVKHLKEGPAGHSRLKASHGKQLKEGKLFSFFKVLFYSRYMYFTKK